MKLSKIAFGLLLTLAGLLLMLDYWTGLNNYCSVRISTSYSFIPEENMELTFNELQVSIERHQTEFDQHTVILVEGRQECDLVQPKAGGSALVNDLKTPAFTCEFNPETGHLMFVLLWEISE